MSSSEVFRFGFFEANVGRNTLTRNGVRIKVQDQPFRVLTLLLDRPGEIITREELRRELWAEGTYVDFDNALNVILKKLRTAIDDDSDNPRFIETVPKRGYRFIAPVSLETVGAGGSGISETADVQISSATVRETTVVATRDSSRQPSLLRICVAVTSVLLVGMGVVWFVFQKKQPIGLPLKASAHVPIPKSVAVLPFSNEGAGPDFDYLRYAIANDLATDLTHAHSVSVRPLALTSGYSSELPEPSAVGKKLRVTHVVAGGFLVEKRSLRVSVELVDVALNQVVWREDVTVSPQELIALHDKLAVRVRQGLLPAMNMLQANPDEIPTPKNEQALDLFLHSLSIPLDPKPNLVAIKKLEKSVSLDSGYAPAWGELGWRYYLDFHYGSGKEAAIAKSLQAYTRQSELDPNTSPVWTNIRVEQGDLNGAYDQAVKFLRRRPDLSTAHFGLSYVFRYAGLLEEAGKECDDALALDPGFNGLRTCAIPLIMAGDYTRAQPYINLDERFGTLLRLRIALRTRNTAEILADYTLASQFGFRKADDLLMLSRSCVNHAPVTELVARIEADPVWLRDPELLYQNAELLAFCGEGNAALRELAGAIKGNHCSYPAMDKDPLFDPIRQRSEFAELRQAAIQCQQDFLAHRRQSDEH